MLTDQTRDPVGPVSCGVDGVSSLFKALTLKRFEFNIYSFVFSKIAV